MHYLFKINYFKLLSLSRVIKINQFKFVWIYSSFVLLFIVIEYDLRPLTYFILTSSCK